MLRTTSGLGPYLVVCADCMLAMVYIAVLVCTNFHFTLISPVMLSSLFSFTGLIVPSGGGGGGGGCDCILLSGNQQEISILEKCASYIRSSLLSLYLSLYCCGRKSDPSCEYQ